MDLLSKSLLAAVTLSTASVYFAQSTKDSLRSTKDIEEVVLVGTADIAKDRKTPVAVSKIGRAHV